MEGWGGPWWETPVKAGEPSDPYLMTGFDQKCVHLSHDSKKPVAISIEVDALGTGTFHTWRTIDIAAGASEVVVFPPGFSAHWVRVVADKNCSATAHFHYT